MSENKVAGTLNARPTWPAVSGKRDSLETKVVSTWSADVSSFAEVAAPDRFWPAAEPITEKRTDSRRAAWLASRRRLFGPEMEKDDGLD